MDGETVYVAVRTYGGRDRLGNPINGWDEPAAVDHVLVSESTDDDQSYTRPDGVHVVPVSALRP